MSHETIKPATEKKKSYYDVLGVPKDVDAEKLRSTYWALAKKFHPDVNPGSKAAEEKFKNIAEAYEVLSDPEKRTSYDRRLSETERAAVKPQEQETFWQSEVRGGAERVWKENTTFWQHNEKDQKKEKKRLLWIETGSWSNTSAEYMREKSFFTQIHSSLYPQSIQKYIPRTD